MENELEPKPGSLRSKWMDHEEPVPSQAWEGIESRLRKRKRRPFVFWWLFGGLALLTCAYLVLNKTLGSSSNETAQMTPASELSKPGRENTKTNQSALPNLKQKAPSGNPQNLDSEKPTNPTIESTQKPPLTQKHFPNEIEKTAQSGSTDRRTRKQAYSPQNTLAQKVVPGSIPEPNDSEPRSEKRSRRKSTKEKSIALIQTADQQPDLQLSYAKPERRSPEEPEYAGSQEQKPEKALLTDTQRLIPQTQANPALVDVSFMERKEVERVLMAIRLPEPAMVPMPEISALPADCTANSPAKQKAGWEFSLGLGSLSQSVQIKGEQVQNYQTDNTNLLVDAMSSSLRLPLLAELQLSWHFPVIQSVWLGGGLRSTWIQQKNRFQIRPGVNSGTRFLAGPDSLSFIAQSIVMESEMSYQQVEGQQEAMLHLEWAPGFIPLRFRVNWAPVRLRACWQNGNLQTEWASFSDLPWPDARLAYALSRRTALALQFRYQTGVDQALPLPVANTGNRWLYSLGYVWSW